jgi:hypothetical protein
VERERHCTWDRVGGMCGVKAMTNLRLFDLRQDRQR